MGLFDGLVGGLTGLVSGGPVGAGLGALGGLFGQNDARTESGVNLRPLTPQEQAIQRQAMSQIQGLTGQLGAAQDPGNLQALYNAIYNPAATAINESFVRGGAAQDAQALLRGTGPSSRMQENVVRRQGQQAQALGNASSQATLGAQQMAGQQAATAANSIGSLQSVLNSLYANQMGQSTQFTREPGAGANAAFGAMGTALTGNDSWWNKGGSQKVGNALGGLLGIGGV